MADRNEPTVEERREQRRAMRHESRAASTWKGFLKELMAVGDIDEGLAECAAVSVLKLLEQRIYGDEVRQFEAQLPVKLRELLQTAGGEHEGKPTLKFGVDGLIQRVADELKMSPQETEPVVRAVFAAVRAQITEGEASDIAEQLPKDLAELWMLPV